MHVSDDGVQVRAFEPGDLALEVLSRQVRAETVNLKDSPVIVAGGGGVDEGERQEKLQ